MTSIARSAARGKENFVTFTKIRAMTLPVLANCLYAPGSVDFDGKELFIMAQLRQSGDPADT
jgi:hypothetical protein